MIFIDNREARSIVPRQLEKLKVPIEMMGLKVGDYLVTGQVNVCVERKTTSDYVRSLIRRRLNNQLYNMSLNYPYSILILEGFISEALFHRKMRRQAYISSLVGSTLEHAPDGEQGLISILPAETPFDSALILSFIHKKINEPDGLIRLPKAERFRFSDSQRQIVTLSTLPHIGEQKSKALLRKFKSISQLSNASVTELTTVPGIGMKIATRVHKFLNLEYE